jgi:uncharacterized protein YjbJ (UPF0337 family)
MVAHPMDWQQIEKSWDKYVSAAKERWMKLSLEQLKATRGRHAVLALRIQEAYGLSAEQTGFQISEWQSRLAAR